MARMARLVIPGVPHHVTQRGNGRAPTFFRDDGLGLAADDGLTATGPVLERFSEIAERIAAGEDEATSARLRRAEQIGRPVGDAAFIAALERRTSRSLTPTPPGPKPKDRHDGGAAS
jgi:hypothetical protein